MTRVTVAPGVVHWPGKLAPEEQAALVAELRAVARKAPFFQPRMPKTGNPFSVRMTNCGSLGWVSDINGYRYQPEHPETGEPWPIMPAPLLDLWQELAGYPHPPEACLVNFYGSDAKMGLHQDKDEADLRFPVLSVSLGDTAVFRLGGPRRGDPTASMKLTSGDVCLLAGASRMFHHGVDRILPGSSQLIPGGGRINLTLRRAAPSS